MQSQLDTLFINASRLTHTGTSLTWLVSEGTHGIFHCDIFTEARHVSVMFCWVPLRHITCISDTGELLSSTHWLFSLTASWPCRLWTFYRAHRQIELYYSLRQKHRATDLKLFFLYKHVLGQWQFGHFLQNHVSGLVKEKRSWHYITAV